LGVGGFFAGLDLPFLGAAATGTTTATTNPAINSITVYLRLLIFIEVSPVYNFRATLKVPY
jgi:hypothetical protein